MSVCLSVCLSVAPCLSVSLSLALSLSLSLSLTLTEKVSLSRAYSLSLSLSVFHRAPDGLHSASMMRRCAGRLRMPQAGSEFNSRMFSKQGEFQY